MYIYVYVKVKTTASLQASSDLPRPYISPILLREPQPRLLMVFAPLCVFSEPLCFRKGRQSGCLLRKSCPRIRRASSISGRDGTGRNGRGEKRKSYAAKRPGVVDVRICKGPVLSLPLVAHDAHTR